ncbi:hypothetical protein RUND412_000175 [Rhizina undulata]
MASALEAIFPTTEQYQKLLADVEGLEDSPCFDVIKDLVTWVFTLQKALDRATADLRLLSNDHDNSRSGEKGKKVEGSLDPSREDKPANISSEESAPTGEAPYNGSSTLPPPSSTGYEYYYITPLERNASAENTTYQMHMLPLDRDTLTNITLEESSFYALNEYQLTALQNLLEERNSRTAGEGHWVLSGLRTMADILAVVIRFSVYVYDVPGDSEYEQEITPTCITDNYDTRSSVSLDSKSGFPRYSESIARGNLKPEEMAILHERDPKFKETHEEYETSLRARWETLGPDHEETLEIMERLAQLFLGQKKPVAVEFLYREIYERREETFGRDHDKTLMARYRLGHACRNMGRLSEAEMLIEGAFTGFRNTKGPSDPLTLMAKNLLEKIRL